jgi:hypothetical protein
MFFLDVKNVFLTMFFGAQKCDVGLVEKNVKRTCEYGRWNRHVSSLEHVSRVWVCATSLPAKRPCHCHLGFHLGPLKVELSSDVDNVCYVGSMSGPLLGYLSDQSRTCGKRSLVEFGMC